MPSATELPDPASFSPSEIRLLRGTYAILAEYGTHQTSLRGIARALNVSPSLLVYHFGNLENLLVSTMLWAFEASADQFEVAVAKSDDPRAMITVFLDRILVGPKESREHFLIYLDFVQYSVRQPAVGGINIVWQKYLTKAFRDLVQAGAESGVFAVDDVESAARGARAVVDGLLLQWLQEPHRPQTYTAMRADCEQALLVLLRATGAPEAGKAKPRAAQRRIRANRAS